MMHRFRHSFQLSIIAICGTLATGGDSGCLADFNSDGELNFFDVSGFLVGFNEQSPISDLNGDDSFNFFDVSMFLVSFAEGCPLADSDGDRIPDVAETDNGIYIDENSTGTDPNNPDTDGDGILDGDEVYGTLGGLDLPALGANPLRRDIFVEADWHGGFVEDDFRVFRPSEAAINRIVECFAAAPLDNPYGGADGIDIHIDYGQGGPYTNGQQIAGDPPVFVAFGNQFNQIKANNFDSNRLGYFHYCLFTNRHSSSNNGSSGVAELHGDDLMVTLFEFHSTYNASQTFVHEIGHNLGLHHGGFEPLNWKPNYNSVMNYRFQFPGIDVNNDAFGDGVLDYSRGLRREINESQVFESLGVIGRPLDFNGNGIIEIEPYSANMNCFDVLSTSCGDGEGCYDDVCSLLEDVNDWEIINWSRLQRTAERVDQQPEILDCDNPPPGS